ncbi:MAG TPA: radical SAM protein [Thermoanaerobaculia bacterium]
MVAIRKVMLDSIDIRDLIVPGVGNRRIFRILLTNTCRFACDYCPMRAERDLPRRALEPASLARLFMTAFRRGWCDGLFVTSGIPKDPVFAMKRMLELVETLRFTHGYRGYLHAKALAGAQPGQIERLVRLVDRVSYNLEAPCQRALDEHAPGKSVAKGVALLEPNWNAATAVREARRASARLAPEPLSFAEGLEKKRLIQADHLLREYGFTADELVYGKDGHLPLDHDPKLTWALANPGRFPVELTTAGRDELQRVPGFGPLAVERILSTRARGSLSDATDLKRLGVQVGRAGGFVTLRGRPIGTCAIQTPLFATACSRDVYELSPGAFR